MDRWLARRARAGRAAMAATVLLVACGRAPVVPAEGAPSSTTHVAHAAQTASPAVVVASALPITPEPTIEPAYRLDEHVGDTPVRVHRLVYRFVLRVPWSLGSGRPELLPPTGELYVDSAGGRLRARFVGNGWPVDDGSEVRMRSDLPGVYVFDAAGGRPVGTGQLAAWFQAGPGARTVELTVRTSAADEPTTVDLVCRLFGEWAGTSIASVRRACVADGLPVRFNFGPYRVERTAEASLVKPERALRSDHLDPPRGLVHLASVAFHSREELRLAEPTVDDPVVPRHPPEVAPPPVEDGLEAENRTGARVLVTIDGVALGWLDPGARMSFPGIPAGGHLVGAMLPLGSVVSRRHGFVLPGYCVLQRLASRP